MSMSRKLRRVPPPKAPGSVDIGDTDVRHGGRTIQVMVSVNTDEDEMVVLERVRAAARGPRVAMCVCSVGVMRAEDSAKLWEEVVPAATREAAKGSS